MQCFFHHPGRGDTAGAPKHTHIYTPRHQPFSTILHANDGVRTLKQEEALPSLVSPALLYSLLLLEVVLKCILFTECISASPTLCTPPCLSLSPYSSLPLLVLSIRTGHAFLINHFYSFYLLFIFVVPFFSLQIPGLNLMQSACLAHKQVRERKGGDSEIQDSNYQLRLERGCAFGYVCVCLCQGWMQLGVIKLPPISEKSNCCAI